MSTVLPPRRAVCRCRRRLLTAAGVGLALLCALAVRAENTHPVVEAAQHAGTPAVDGVLDDACWQSAFHTDEFYDTGHEVAPEERTEAWLCWDAEACYVAIFAHDSQPESISAQETKRGGNIWQDDYVDITLDPDYSFSRAWDFRVTAGGVQHESIPGGSDAKIEWRGDWTAAARITAEGWTAELRIPYGILRYPAGQTAWGMQIARRHARTNSGWNWPPQRRPWQMREIAEIRGLQLPELRPQPILMATLQASAGEGEPRVKLSLDAKSNLPHGLTGMVSLQPDFQDVEQQVESIDFSYTERSYPDRRPFFVEGGGFMPPRQLLYSRRIEDFDVGAKLFGEVGNTSLGVLDTWSRDDRNFFGVSVGQQLGRYGNAGVVLVSTDQPDLENTAYSASLGYGHPLGKGSWGVNARWFGAETEGGAAGESWRAGANLDQGPGKPSGWVDWRQVDPDFAPALGYVPETDLRALSGGVGLGHEYSAGARESDYLWANTGVTRRYSGDLYHRDVSGGYSQNYRNGRWWNAGASWSDRPPNEDLVWSAGYGWNSKDIKRGGAVSLRAGRLGGADYLYASASQGFSPNPRLSCYLGLEYRRSDYPEPTADEEIERATLSFTYDLSTERSFGGRLLAGTAGTNFFATFRQAVRRGMDLFLVFGDPNAETTQTRVAVKAKWTYR